MQRTSPYEGKHRSNVAELLAGCGLQPDTKQYAAACASVFSYVMAETDAAFARGVKYGQRAARPRGARQ